MQRKTTFLNAGRRPVKKKKEKIAPAQDFLQTQIAFPALKINRAGRREQSGLVRLRAAHKVE